MKNKVKVTRILAILLLLICGIIYYNGYLYIPVYQDGELFIAEWVFRETHKGTIIGNPDFVASYIEVNEDTMIDKYKAVAEDLGFDHTIEKIPPRSDSHFQTAFLIDELFYLDYDEGYCIMDADAFKASPKQFNEVFRTLILTFDPQATINDLDEFLNQETTIKFLDYNYLYMSSKVGFRCYDDDGLYKLEIEDLRMGH